MDRIGRELSGGGEGRFSVAHDVTVRNTGKIAQRSRTPDFGVCRTVLCGYTPALDAHPMFDECELEDPAQRSIA